MAMHKIALVLACLSCIVVLAYLAGDGHGLRRQSPIGIPLKMLGVETTVNTLKAPTIFLQSPTQVFRVNPYMLRARFSSASAKLPTLENHPSLRGPSRDGWRSRVPVVMSMNDKPPLQTQADYEKAVLKLRQSLTSRRSSAVIQRPLKQGGMIITQPTARSDVQTIADFLTDNFYATDEKNLFQRLALGFWFAVDLQERYEEITGQGREPSSLFMIKEGEEVIGCVLLHTRVLNKRTNKFRLLGRTEMIVNGENNEWVVLVLSNLVIRKDKRRQGLARELLAVAEEQAKAWNYHELYLSVEMANKRAQMLYESSGYKVIFEEDQDASVGPQQLILRMQKCSTLYKRLSDAAL